MPSLAYDRPFQKHLFPGESVLWVGRPPQGFLFRGTDWVFIPFSLAWAGVAFLWEATALGFRTMHYNPCAGTCGLPFVAVGAHMLLGRFFYDRYQRGRTWYAITDRRALMLYVGNALHLYGVALSESPDIKFQPHLNGTTSIVFKPRKPDPYWRREGFLDFGRPTDFTFEQLDNADELRPLLFLKRPGPDL